MPRSTAWEQTLRLHSGAAKAYVEAAVAVPAERWQAPRAEGKWSAAQITEHLSRAYEVLLQELGGGPGMAIRTKWWQRLLLRFTVVPRLRAGGWFPKGARAPRETRPAESLPAQADAIARFQELAARFETAAGEARTRRPRQRLTHAYFGASSVRDAVLLCARHIKHHERQLAELSEPAPARAAPGTGSAGA